jgi:hypothetical protein
MPMARAAERTAPHAGTLQALRSQPPRWCIAKWVGVQTIRWKKPTTTRAAGQRGTLLVSEAGRTPCRLAQGTRDAGQRETVRHGRPARGSGCDVIDMEGSLLPLLSQAAVFTTSGRSILNKPAQPWTDIAHALPAVDLRARSARRRIIGTEGGWKRPDLAPRDYRSSSGRTRPIGIRRQCPAGCTLEKGTPVAFSGPQKSCVGAAVR